MMLKHLLKSIFKKCRPILNCICFLGIVSILFVGCTYLFRNPEEFGRETIIGIKSEPENSIDVVFIGGSSVYRFWDTMRAYNSYGFTSYDYSVSGMAAASTISCIKDVFKTQSPQLVVFDVRKLLSGFENSEIGRDTRNVFDSQDISLDRFQAVHYFCSLNDISLKDSLSEYFDIILYHDNIDGLSDEKHWRYIDNRGYDDLEDDNVFKGFVVYARQNIVEEPPEDYFTDEVLEISDDSQKILSDIIKYCKKKGIILLLTASPYSLSKENAQELNYIAKVAEENNILFIDANRHYEEMGLSFDIDFDDSGHVNNLGAKKYTDYLAPIILKNFELPDHRDDANYYLWNDLYENYIEYDNRVTSEITIQAQSRLNSIAKESKIISTTDLKEWLKDVYDENYTVLFFGNEVINVDSETELLLEHLGINENALGYGIFSGYYSSNGGFLSIGDEGCTCKSLEDYEDVEMVIDTVKGWFSVGETRYESEDAGIHFLVMNNNTEKAFDHVLLRNSDSVIELIRKED